MARTRRTQDTGHRTQNCQRRAQLLSFTARPKAALKDRGRRPTAPSRKCILLGTPATSECLRGTPAPRRAPLDLTCGLPTCREISSEASDIARDVLLRPQHAVTDDPQVYLLVCTYSHPQPHAALRWLVRITVHTLLNPAPSPASARNPTGPLATNERNGRCSFYAYDVHVRVSTTSIAKPVQRYPCNACQSTSLDEFPTAA
jgi:hypothetical protein